MTQREEIIAKLLEAIKLYPRRIAANVWLYHDEIERITLDLCFAEWAHRQLETTTEDKMEGFKNYRKKNVQPMRPYVPGEDMTGISVSAEDTPELGGMIAVNPSNEKDRWYVAKQFFLDNYIEA